jgi:hypothetical protein
VNVNLQTEQHEENVKETSYTVGSLDGDQEDEDGFARQHVSNPIHNAVKGEESDVQDDYARENMSNS